MRTSLDALDARRLRRHPLPLPTRPGEIAHGLFSDAGEGDWLVSPIGPRPIGQELCEHVRERFGLVVLPEA